MKQQTLLAIAVTPFGVVSIEQPAVGHAERDLPDLPAPAMLPRRQVVAARWYSTEDGRLEARWLPTTPEAA